MEDLVKDINEMLLDDIITEILREDRDNLRTEKKRAWSSRRTRAPFYSQARGKSKINDLGAALDLAEKAVEHLGPPWKISKKGRPPEFSPEKLASALLAKHFQNTSFEVLRKRLSELRFNCYLSNKKKGEIGIPSKSELHWAMDKIPEWYFQEAVRLIDDWAAELHVTLFGFTEINKFGVDGTEITCVELEEVMIGLKMKLRRTTDKVNAISRLVTNTICETSSSKSENLRDLKTLLKNYKASGRKINGMEVSGDAAYDAEYNHEYGCENDVDLIIKPTEYSKRKCKGFYRKKAQKNFSYQRYRMRKTTERPFGNMTLRDGNKIQYKRPDMKRKGELLRFIAHNMKAYFMQEAWDKIFIKL